VLGKYDDVDSLLADSPAGVDALAVLLAGTFVRVVSEPNRRLVMELKASSRALDASLMS
jgi:hypothetical protein